MGTLGVAQGWDRARRWRFVLRYIRPDPGRSGHAAQFLHHTWKGDISGLRIAVSGGVDDAPDALMVSRVARAEGPTPRQPGATSREIGTRKV